MRFAYLMQMALVMSVLSAQVDRADAQVEPRPPRGGRKVPVEIDSAPQQAAIYLDDERYGIIGYTPWTGTLEEGTWTVILKKDGYEMATRTIIVKPSSRRQETFVPMTRLAGEPAPAPSPTPAPTTAPAPAAPGPAPATSAPTSPTAAPPGAAPAHAGGGLRFVSTPRGATVLIDGEPVGETPMLAEDVAAGEHVVSIEADGYYAFENGVTVRAGEVQLVKANLKEKELSDEEKALVQRGLTTFGARALPAGRSTIAFGAGFPYLLSARFMVGVGRLSEQLQFDAGAHFRTYGARWELSAVGRATFVDTGPFAFGAFVDTGGGSTYFDNSKRDSFFFNGGLMASLNGLGAATLTGRAYLNAWTDRHCPELDGGDLEIEDDDAADVCADYLRGRLDPEEKRRIDRLLDGEDEIFNRDAGARLITSLAIEIALSDDWSLWGLFEGVPRQDERAAYTDFFHRTMFEHDPRTYVTIGLTAKF